LRRSRGASLVEVMLSMGVVLVGMLALFRVLATSITGSATAAHLTQAQLRASSLVETLRFQSRATLGCLAATTSTGWSGCGPMLALQSSDRSGQVYRLDPASAVTVSGTNGGAFDIRVVVSFDDRAHHTVVLRTAVYP
jgi:Tfp pilus assembly protein PilV